MTPEAWAALGTLTERFGLPVAILAGLLWALFTKRLYVGSAVDAMLRQRDEDHAREVSFLRELHASERTDRMAAETTIRDFAPAVAKLAESVEDLAEAAAKPVRVPRGR